MRTNCSADVLLKSFRAAMEMQGSIASELYSEILQSSSVESDRGSTAAQVNNDSLGNDLGDSWYDDEFSCEDSVEALNKASDMEREWNKRRNQFHTIGYRDGLIAGKEAAAQEGFNIGFKDSVLTGYNWGLVRGITSAMACLPGELKEKLVETEETRNKFQKLHESVQSLSTTDALKLFYEAQKRKSLDQKDGGKPSSSGQDDKDQSLDVSALENYSSQLQSILDESPLVKGYSKLN